MSSLSNITNAQLHLIVLIGAIIVIYFIYPEYLYIVTPIFIAISLYYSSTSDINSILSPSPDFNNFIVNNKMYLMYAFIAIPIYMLFFTNYNYKTVNKKESFSSDSSF